MEKVIRVTPSLVLAIIGNAARSLPRSAVIRITIEFMNPKCNFPVVFKAIGSLFTWTVTVWKKYAWESVGHTCMYVFLFFYTKLSLW